jgi:predicted Zn-dependent peptidase
MEFKKIVLNNGLTILHEKRDVPVTTVMLATKFGASYEEEKDKGISHFIEHLCFKGTEKRTTQQISSEVERVGGILNAFTDEEITAYHAVIPSNYLKIAMDVIFDIFFNPVFPDLEIEKERKVILEEIKMYRDHPRAYVMNKLKEQMYEKPFGIPIIGTEKSVGSLDKKKILETHRKMYSPKNAILCVVGNNSFEEIIALSEKFCVDRNFEIIKSKKCEEKNTNGMEKRTDLEQANIAIGFHFPFAENKNQYSAEIFNAILGEGMSSRLFSEVREKRGLAYAVKTELALGKKYAYFLIYIGTDISKIDEVLKICVDEYKKMSVISDEEFNQAKEQIIGNKKVESEGSSETAVGLILEELHSGAENFYLYDQKIKEVSLEDVKKLAEIEKYSYFVLSPVE